MKNAKTFSLMLLMALLASLASCGGDAPTNDTTAASGDTTAAVTEAGIAPPAIEQKDYEGAAFNVWAPSWGSYSTLWHAEEQTGDIMDDSLYERNRMVEEYLGVDITFRVEHGIHDMANLISAMVMAGDTDTHLILTHCIAGLGEMVTSNLLYPWNEIDTVDLSREWWNQSISKNMNFYGKQFLAVSDYMIKAPYCIYFNEDLIDEFQLESPYDLVRNKEWTIDKMLEMSEVVTKDLDGNSVMDAKDRYGFATCGDSQLIPFLYSAGLSLTQPTSDGGLELCLKNERTITLCETLNKLINESESSYLWPYSGGTSVSFKDGQMLFYCESVNLLSNTRDYEIGFGVIPYPLLDTTQDEYRTNDWGGFMTVPNCPLDMDMVGEVVEMLSYYSMDTTVPTYYNKVLGDKLSQNEDMVEMLDLIFDSIVYDAGPAFLGFSGNMAQLFYMLPRMIYGTGEANFASWYDTNGAGAEQQLMDFLEACRKIAEN